LRSAKSNKATLRGKIQQYKFIYTQLTVQSHNLARFMVVC